MAAISAIGGSSGSWRAGQLPGDCHSFRRGYATELAAERASAQVYLRFRHAEMEICPYWRESGFWVQDGEPERLSWCLCRTGRLGWADDAWACTRCGDEWAGEIVWGERDASGGGSGMRLTPLRAIPDQPGRCRGSGPLSERTAPYVWSA